MLHPTPFSFAIHTVPIPAAFFRKAALYAVSDGIHPALPSISYLTFQFQQLLKAVL